MASPTSNTNIKKDQLDQQIVDSSQHKIQEDANIIDEKEKKISWKQFFRFAKKKDYVLMAFGTFFALANGATMPLFALLWGGMLDSFQDQDQMVKQTKRLMLTFIYIGLGVFTSGWIMIACWLVTGERQAIQCRKQYLKSLLKQEMGWYDMINQAELSSQFSADTMAFQGSISDKIPIVFYVIAMGITGLIISFVNGWLMTFVLFACFPIIVFSMYLYMRNIANKSIRQEKAYKLAGGHAQQALSGIKTVKMLNGEQFQSQKYDRSLQGASQGLVRFGILGGISLGAAFFAMLCSYALGFWFGAQCIAENKHCRPQIAKQQYTTGVVFSVFFAIVIVGFNMSQLPPSLKKISQGRQAAKRICEIIDREPKIKNPPNGIKIQDFKGIIQFHNVSFSYPKNKEKKILNNLSFKMQNNKISLVGQSGCGKSTIMQLLMRFYDPDEGKITIDGVDLRQIDLIWLREIIGYVGQQPVLFATSVKENLLFAKENATDSELQAALKKAEAWQFVNQLQDKWDTYVGLGGGQISGGQKQRIAIARAILRDPQILLLDEATSALDRKNQKMIQNTLQKISESKISITIAHRIKTVMNSDTIFVIDQGRVLEHGKFKELNRFKGVHFESEEDTIDLDKSKKQSAKLEKGKYHQDGFLNLEIDQADLKTKKLTKEEKQKKQKQEMIQVYKRNTFGRVFSYAKGTEGKFLIGLFCSGVAGSIYPTFSIFLSNMILIMLGQGAKADKYGSDSQQFRDSVDQFINKANLYALIFFLLGLLAFIMSIVQNLTFAIIGDQVTKKIRSQVFMKMMRLPVSWFEKPKNNVGALTTRLSVDCRQVKQMTTTYIYMSFQLLVCLLTGLIIAFIFQWRTALVSLALTPFMIVAGAIRMAFRSGSATTAEETYKESSNIIMESMTNIRTVCSFGYENIILNKFSKILDVPLKLAVKNGLVSGFFYGLAQFIMFLTVAIIFYLGAIFVRDNDLLPRDMFIAIFAIFFSAMTVGNNSQILPDMAECKVAAGSLFVLLDSQDEEQMQIRQNSKMLKTPIEGDIKLENIKFKYETRSEYLFNNFSLNIEYGQKSAFVGTSGCGKSTIMSLLLRFYEIQNGQISLNGINIKDYDIHFLRDQFAVVSQEPLLFNTSFRENIRYNLPLESVPEEEIYNAADQAHASQFIVGNEKILTEQNQNNQNDEYNLEKDKEQGYDRQVGIKGSHISGGQKQRVAIARAILRKPNFLLLDEATSALDSKNEKIVQDAMDQIMEKKTTISIAHRLDTIKNSKTIFVFDKGRIVQQGNYKDLMSKKGYFYNLQKGIQFK